MPFIDSWHITEPTLQNLARLTSQPAELIVIDNGSDKDWHTEIKEIIAGSSLDLIYVANTENIGVLPTYKQALEYVTTDVVCYFHNDVLIHDAEWDKRVTEAFDADQQLGLAGLFGARGVHPDGGREGSMSHMLGQVWGKCDCHNPVAMHHGELMVATYPAAVFDGVGLFFRTSLLHDLAEHTDLFAEWRAPHHFYDRIMSLKVLERGFHMAVIGIRFDHYSGATANHSQKYVDFCTKWLKDHGHELNNVGVDDTIYWLAEKQWREEYAHRLPVRVDHTYNTMWTA